MRVHPPGVMTHSEGSPDDELVLKVTRSCKGTARLPNASIEHGANYGYLT